MTDSDYIPPSERDAMQSRACFCSDTDIRRGWHKMNCPENDRNAKKLRRVINSHAVVDSVAQDQHSALRLAARFIMGRSNGNLVTESQAIEWLTGAPSVLARWDALRKEAGQ